MTLDSSALLAILFSEAGHLELIDCILEADHVRVGSPTLVETVLVLAGRRPRLAAAQTVDALVKELGVTVVAFGERESEGAIDAFLRFGQGRHPANLNFGDCLLGRDGRGGQRLPAVRRRRFRADGHPPRVMSRHRSADGHGGDLDRSRCPGWCRPGL